MFELRLIATLLMAAALISPAWQGSAQMTRGGLRPPPIVSVTDAPAGTETLKVQWFKVVVPDRGAMFAAVARPSGVGPFPVVLVLHGTHGFARQYVELAQDLARGGFLAVAGCWFSGAENPNRVALRDVRPSVNAVSPPIACPEAPPLGPGAYEEGLQYIDALVQATRALPGARPDRLALVGHSRGGAGSLQYVLAIGNVQAIILHDAGHALRPVTRAAEFKTPILVMHGTADGPASGGSVNTDVALAREFEAALRRNGKTVEANYYEGGGHNTFFTDSTQRDDEVKRMIGFLRRYLGK
jgi:carboxymethylenebutenolidase